MAALQVKRLKRRVELARSFGKPSIIIESNSFEMPRHFVRTSDAIMFQVQVGAALGIAPSAHRDPAERAAPAKPAHALSQGIARGVTASGEVLLETAAGVMHKVSGGEVSLRLVADREA